MTEVEKIVRRNKLGGYLLVGVVAAICGVTVYLFYQSIRQGNEITRVQHSACQSDPAGAECQRAKEESSEAANLRVTCIPFFKAGYPCPKPGSTAASRQAQRRANRARTPEGGDASQSPTSATQQPAPPTGGGGSKEVDTGGAGVEKTPEKLTPPGETAGPADQPTGTQPSSTSTSSSSTTTVTAPQEAAPEPAPQEPAREVLGAVTAPIGGTVETVTGKACEATGLLCSK